MRGKTVILTRLALAMYGIFLMKRPGAVRHRSQTFLSWNRLRLSFLVLLFVRVRLDHSSTFEPQLRTTLEQDRDMWQISTRPYLRRAAGRSSAAVFVTREQNHRARTCRANTDVSRMAIPEMRSYVRNYAAFGKNVVQ